MGSNLQCRHLDAQRDWMGHENASEVLNLSRPDIIQEIHEAFLAVGCDINAANRAMKELGRRVPLMVQASFDQGGQQMLTGSDPSALIAAIEPYSEVEVLGANCAFGPSELSESVRFIAENWPRLV